MARVLTVEQAAEKLQMSPKMVRMYLRVGKLPGRKIGRAWRVLDTDLEWYIGGYSRGVARMDRVSALGLCSDLPGLSTEEFARRKRREIEHEEERLRRVAESGQ